MGNEDAAGKFYKVRPLGRRKIDLKALDPGHGPADVREQIAGGMAGFLKNYGKAFERNSKDNPPPSGFKFDPTLVLAYLRADDVPVYDYLARSFQVCDRWFSSVPGPTWPNRLYAVTGESDGTTANRRPPIYDLKAFVRKLDADDVSWRWYSHDPGTLPGIDGRYRLEHDDEFAYFDRKTLFERQTFLDDARGRLPAVSWIDPNFVDFRLFGPPGSNDDHPPSPTMAGQELVLNVLTAVMRSPAWKKSLLVITYDEHGRLLRPRGSATVQGRGRPAGHAPLRSSRPALVVSPYVEAWRQPRGLRPHVDHQDDPAALLFAPGYGGAIDGSQGRRSRPSWVAAHPSGEPAARARFRPATLGPGGEDRRLEA